MNLDELEKLIQLAIKYKVRELAANGVVVSLYPPETPDAN